MKIGTALLIVFAIWFGYAQYAEHQSAVATQQAANQRERFEGFERCMRAPSGEVLQPSPELFNSCSRVWFTGYR